MNSLGLGSGSLLYVGYAAFIDAHTHVIAHRYQRDRAVNTPHGNFYLSNSFDRLLTRNVIFLCNEGVKSLFLK